MSHFIDESIVKPQGEPIEYTGKPLEVYKADFINPYMPGIEVEEISMQEWTDELEAARERAAKKAGEAVDE